METVPGDFYRELPVNGGRRTSEEDGGEVCGNGPHRRKLLRLAAVVVIVAVGVLLAVLLTRTRSSSHDGPPLSHRHFLHLSDIHLDPDYDPQCSSTTLCRIYPPTGTCYPANGRAVGRYGCDSPPPLLHSMLQAATATTPDFVVMSGDFVAHLQTSSNASLHVLRKATSTMKAAFPTSIVLPVLGNNDFAKDYCIPLANNSWFDTVSAVFGDWLQHSTCEQCMDTFRQGGFYASTPVAGLRVLVLNTVLYSVSRSFVNCTVLPGQFVFPPIKGKLFGDEGARSQDISDDARQLEWLQSQLALARQQAERVLIVGHIAPGVNGFDEAELWTSNATQRYFSILKQYSDVVELQLFGHLHRDDFRSYTGSGVPGALLMGSLSPLTYNNPSYRRVYYSVDSADTPQYERVDDVYSYMLDLDFPADGWTLEYSFKDAYGVVIIV